MAGGPADAPESSMAAPHLLSEPLAAVDLPLRFADGSEAIAHAITAEGMDIETSAPVSTGQTVVLELRPVGSAVIYVAQGLVDGLQTQGHVTVAHVKFTSVHLKPVR